MTVRHSFRYAVTMIKRSLAVVTITGFSWLAACGSGTDADRLGIAAVCEDDDDCLEVTVAGETVQLTCIKDFSAGYCSIPDCESNADCPDAATCVAHTDQRSYCFRECSEKPDCNRNRPPSDEANCSSSFDYADAGDAPEKLKACIPPSSG